LISIIYISIVFEAAFGVFSREVRAAAAGERKKGAPSKGGAGGQTEFGMTG